MASDEAAHTEGRSAERRRGWLLAAAGFGAVLLVYGAIGYAVYRLVTALF